MSWPSWSWVMGTYKCVRETPEEGSFLADTFTDSRGYTLPCRMVLPPARPAHAEVRVHDVDRERMPLVLLLHGVGESGNDNSAQLRNGVAELLGSGPAAARFPCYYVVPQCTTKHRWGKWIGAPSATSCRPSRRCPCRQRWSFSTCSSAATLSIRSASTSSECQWGVLASGTY